MKNDPEITIALTLRVGDWLSLYFAAQQRVESAVEELADATDGEVREDLGNDLAEYRRVVARLGAAITTAEVPDRDLYGLD